jgi:hypothetical protein
MDADVTLLGCRRAPFRTAGKVPQEVYWSLDYNDNPITSIAGPAKVIYCPAVTDTHEVRETFSRYDHLYQHTA